MDLLGCGLPSDCSSYSLYGHTFLQRDLSSARRLSRRTRRASCRYRAAQRLCARRSKSAGSERVPFTGTLLVFSAVDAQDGQVRLAFAPERGSVYPSVWIGATLVSRARYRGSTLTTHEREPGHSTYWPRLTALAATYAFAVHVWRFCLCMRVTSAILDCTFFARK